MDSATLFAWLVKYHTEVNLQSCLPRIKDGKVYTNGDYVKPGEENKLTRGCLILADGQTLADRLQSDDIIQDLRSPDFCEIKDYQDFFNFLNWGTRSDGAFIYDRERERMAKVFCISNSSQELKKARRQHQELIPSDFMHYQRTEPLTDEEYDSCIGTKTKLAIVAPPAYSKGDWQVKSFLVKTTAYTDLGIGKVAQFGSRGLEREFFFEYDPASAGPFVTADHPIVGVYRTYPHRTGESKTEGRKGIKVIKRVEEVRGPEYSLDAA